jgi:competence protein ComEC
MKTKRCQVIMVLLVLLILSCAVFPGLAGNIDISSPAASKELALSRAGVSNAGIDISAKAAAATSSHISQIENSSAILPFSDELSVLFINVEKADAILVLYADKAYLIDTGAKKSAPQLISALNLYGISTLDVFLTHTDADHIGGMTALSNNFNIGTLYSAEISEIKKKGGNKIVDLAAKLSLTHKKLRALDKVEITQNIYFEILGPLVYNEGEDNDNSLVIRLSVNGRTLLFTGDMQFAEEDTLLKAGVDLNADILKVGNHGNPDATSERFAAAVTPQYAVISTNTSVDEGSANARVKSALHGATVYITQDYQCGVLVTVHADGSIEFAEPIIP